MKLPSVFRKVIWILLFSFISQLTLAEGLQGNSQPVNPSSNMGKEISANDAGKTPEKTGKDENIKPFVGEIAVGVSLLITYGPQILALAAAVATIAGSISLIVNHSKQSVGLVKSVGEKLKKMLSLLLGPLSISNGTAKEGVDQVSGQLLKVAKYVTNSLSTPVSDVKSNIAETVSLSKDVENLANRGKFISEEMQKVSQNTNADLKKVVAGGEVQIFRDGTINLSNRLNRQALQSTGAFNQTLDNAKMSTSTLESLQASINKALSDSGKNPEEVTLRDIGISNAEVSKKLIDARKYMVLSKDALSQSEKSNSGIHTEILSILKDIKKDLEDFAKSQGVDPAALNRTIKEQTSSGKSSKNLEIQKQKFPENIKPEKLTEAITFMVDDLNQLNEKTKIQLMKMEKHDSSKAAALKQAGSKAIYQDSQQTEPRESGLFDNKLSAYRKLVNIMSRNPGDKRGIEEAKAAYDLADQAYQEELQK